jgi:hypothetical protein
MKIKTQAQEVAPDAMTCTNGWELTANGLSLGAPANVSWLLT